MEQGFGGRCARHEPAVPAAHQPPHMPHAAHHCPCAAVSKCLPASPHVLLPKDETKCHYKPNQTRTGRRHRWALSSLQARLCRAQSAAWQATPQKRTVQQPRQSLPCGVPAPLLPAQLVQPG